MEKKRYKKYEIDTSGGTVYASTASNEESFLLYGTTTLTSGFTLAIDGTPSTGQSINVLYVADVTPNGNTVTIFGNTLTDNECSSKMEIRFLYDGSTWQVVKKIDSGDINVTADDLTSLDGSIIDSASIAPDSVDLADGDVVVGGTSGGESLTVGTSELITKYGGSVVSKEVIGDVAATAAAGGITFTVANDAITNAKLAGMARGTVKAGNSSANPSDLDISADSALAAGNGTDVVAQTLGGDVATSSDGSEIDVSVKKGSYESNVDGGAIGVVSKRIIPDLRGNGFFDGAKNNIMQINSGDYIVGATLYVASIGDASSTVDIGIDANVDGSAENVDGIIEGAALDSVGSVDHNGAEMSDGYIQAATDGYIIMQSSTTITSGNFTLVVEVIKA